MNTKRSYLENLNAGRQRRSGNALEEINRTLDQLQHRLERALEGRERGSSVEDDIAQRMERLSDRAGMRGYSHRAASGETGWSRRRAETPPLRGYGPDRTAVDPEGMHGAVNAGIRQEFAALREEMNRLTAAVPHSPAADGLKQELDRLSDAVSRLAERSDDRSIKLLRLELEQLKLSLAKLAREETVRALDRRWDALEDRLSRPDPMVERLAARLEEISAAVDNLPQSLSLRSLEERIRALAGSIDQLAGQQSRPDLYAMVEERLDEISRAITASAAMAHSPSFDISALERIEARISSLSSQIDEVVQDRPGGLIVERLNALSERVDEIARRIEIPEQVVERFAAHIARISERLDTVPAAPDTDHLFRGLEDRFAHLAELVERRQEDAIQEGRSLFHDLERRLEEIAGRFDSPDGASALRALEARLEDITGRLDDAASASPVVDPELFRNLEIQLANLSAQLAQPEREPAGLHDLGPRLDSIERSISESHNAILEAARQAAAEAAERFAAAASNAGDDGLLREEIEKLHALTRKADERNTKTFEAIHDTLLKIVDRLGALEAGIEETPGKISLDHTPPLETEITGFGGDAQESRRRRTPAEAAAAAAEAALKDEIPDNEPAGRSMLSQFSRAFSGRRREEVELGEREEPMLSADEETEPAIDPGRLNEPLEPGSGAPDLNAIMRRVRDTQEAHSREEEAARADFIAAARRAAQAAAAEASALRDRRENPAGKPRKSGRGGLLGRNRKKLLATVAAGIVIIGGLLFARTLLQDAEPALVAEPVQSGAPVDGENIAVEPMAGAEPAAGEVAAEAPAAEAGSPARIAGSQAQEDPGADTTAEAEAPVEILPDADENAQTAEALPPSEITTSALSADALPDADIDDPAGPATLQIPEIPAEIEPDALREAAAEGDPEALFEIGRRYAEGRGVEPDLAKAARWYELAAEQGLAPAQYRIGNFYEKGTGVERDIAKAKMWYQLAAEQGNASAMHNLGVLYAMGADGTADHETAARWFRRAAELGVADSQFNLGILSAKGAGVPRDLGEAYMWFDIVARTGDADAAAKRDEIAAAMAPTELVKAQDRARAWEARQPVPEANMVDIPAEWTSDASITTGSVDMRKAITNVQLILNKNGFDAGPADGVLGDRTRAAIRAFQKANGLPETGEIDDALVRALLKKNESTG